MTRLLMSELRINWRSWAGVFVLTVAAAFVLAIGAAITETGVELGGIYAENLSGAAAMILMFSGASAMAILSSVAALTITLQHRSYALWQLVGVQPVLIGVIVLVQLLIVAFTGSLFGVLLAWPAAEPLFALGFGALPDLDGVHIHFGAPTVAGTILGLCVIVFLGGWRAARRAAHTPALDILREPEPRRRRMRWLRWLLAAGAAAAVFGFSKALFGVPLRDSGAILPFIAPALTILLVSLAPILYPATLTGWTSLIPARLSSAWFLARNQARYRLAYSTAAITPLLVGISLTGGIFTAATTMNTALQIQGTGGNAELHTNEVAILLGGPILLAAVGSAIVVFITNRTRKKELALLQASGSAHRTIILTAVFEALIYVVTATLLAFAIILASSVIIAAGLSTTIHGTTPIVDSAPALVIAGAGCVLVLIATLTPTIKGLQNDVVSSLSSE